ncbi:MAG: efflux RND transporter periplasmic adaptor subunit [Candidatus Pacebacteria bacterium]|nr:efflux RND transporter periplasmic adaptor subunit [Candidatus Paceibacterota bacterium]
MKKIKISFKSKRLWIIVGIILIASIFIIPMFQGKKVKYETFKIEKGSLVQTVDATGKVESSNKLSLHFDGVGIVETVKVEEGDSVYKGQWLANLSLDQLNAAVNQAQSSLDQKLVGATEEAINVSKRQVESSEVALAKAEETLTDVTSLAEKNLAAEYASALTSMDDAYIKMYNAYSATELIQKAYFSGNDQEGNDVRATLDYTMKTSKESAKTYIDKAWLSSNRADTDTAVSEVVSDLQKILNSLTIVRDVCEGTAYKNKVTTTEKTSLDNQKAYISTSQSTMSGIKNDLSILKTQNENNINTARANVESSRASLELQKANYESLIAKPRDIDIAYYQAALDQATANRNKAIIYAPIPGIVTKVNKKSGELISSSEAMIELLSPHYEIEVDIPETDVVKIQTDDVAEITLDALGNDVKFKGKVLTIDPSSTEIQDVVYYRVKVAIDDLSDLIKPGMSADVIVKTDTREGAIYLPSRAILTRNNDEKYVKILKNDGNIEEKTIQTGLKADDGKTEIISGLNEGEEVILKTIK